MDQIKTGLPLPKQLEQFQGLDGMSYALKLFEHYSLRYLGGSPMKISCLT